MRTVKLFGRNVIPITTLEGQCRYYDNMNYWCSCIHNTNRRLLPTEDEAREYVKLKEERPSIVKVGDKIHDRLERKLRVYKNRYDWRAVKSGEPHSIGLVSPLGEQLLPDIFEDVFTQFDAIIDLPHFVPVSNGEGWALVTLGALPVLMTGYCYNAIMPERWERNMFFVQDNNTMKWGVLRVLMQYTSVKTRNRQYLVTIESLMPCIADDIYEDKFMVDDPDEMPSLLFMLRIGNKVGVLTDYGYSPIIYDTYDTDSRNCSFRLIRNDRKYAHRADWLNPDRRKSFTHK